MRSASSRPRPQAYRPCCPSAWARRRASSPMVLALISSRTAGWPGGGSAQYSPVARPCQIRHCGYRRLSRSSSASSPSLRGPPVMARDGGLRRRGPQADEAAMTASAQRLAPARRALRCRRGSTRARTRLGWLGTAGAGPVISLTTGCKRGGTGQVRHHRQVPARGGGPGRDPGGTPDGGPGIVPASGDPRPRAGSPAVTATHQRGKQARPLRPVMPATLGQGGGPTGRR